MPDFRRYDELTKRDPGYWHRPTMGLNQLERLRFPWFRNHLPALSGARVLDIGCGGGILATSLAQAGASVTGVDPSKESLKAARAHAKRLGLSIRYVHGFAEDLRERAAYDIVFAVDVLEHVNDLSATLDAAARALKPGGWFGYLTHNATLEAFRQIIWEWEYVERTTVRGRHDFHLFIRPDDLAAMLSARGMRVRHQIGIRWKPRLALSRNMQVTYMGLAHKRTGR